MHYYNTYTNIIIPPPVGVESQCLELLQQSPAPMLHWQFEILDHVKHITLSMILEHLKQKFHP